MERGAAIVARGRTHNKKVQSRRPHDLGPNNEGKQRKDWSCSLMLCLFVSLAVAARHRPENALSLHRQAPDSRGAGMPQPVSTAAAPKTCGGSTPRGWAPIATANKQAREGDHSDRAPRRSYPVPPVSAAVPKNATNVDTIGPGCQTTKRRLHAGSTWRVGKLLRAKASEVAIGHGNPWL
jgi:hypothetical protein